jgi:hypothetical protein
VGGGEEEEMGKMKWEAQIKHDRQRGATSVTAPPSTLPQSLAQSFPTCIRDCSDSQHACNLALPHLGRHPPLHDSGHSLIYQGPPYMPTSP